MVEVTLSGSAANVRLLDSGNLQNYKSGRKHRYYGGLARRSPTRLVIPHTGSWYVVVDLQGLSGQVRSSVRVIRQAALSPLPDYSPPVLSGLVRPVSRNNPYALESGGASPSNYYDVFISHATEDKDAVARPLAISPRISDKGWIGQGSDQDLAELARLHALFDVEMRLGHHCSGE